MLVRLLNDIQILGMGHPEAFGTKGKAYQATEANNLPQGGYFLCLEPRGDWCHVDKEDGEVVIPASFNLHCPMCNMKYTEFLPTMRNNRGMGPGWCERVIAFEQIHSKCGTIDDFRLDLPRGRGKAAE